MATESSIVFGFTTKMLNMTNNNHNIPILVVGAGSERRIKIGPWQNLKREHPLLELPR